MKIYEELENAEDVIDWAYNNGWCLGYFKSLESDKQEYIAESILEATEELTTTQLNDILRFECDDILEEYGSDEDDEDY